MKILVIDDDAAVRADLVTTLREIGHTCDEAATVDGALLALASGTYAAAVCDLKLDRDPSTLHAALGLRRLPVLLVSGAEPDRLPEIAARYGWAFLAKPWEPDALVAAVERLVRGSSPDVSGARGEVAAPSKSGAQVLAETLVDLVVAGIIGAVLLIVRPDTVVQVICIGILALLAGVRAADLAASIRGLPTRGGPSAIALATLSAGAARLLGDNT
jgi:CheY-like chemotaxis protein